MMKKVAYIVAAVAMIGALAACSAVQSLTGANTGAAQASNGGGPGGTPQPGGRNGGAFGGDPSKMTVEQKIGIGILKLEGTPNAVSAAQAKDLLPLWQALKSMESSNNASVDEINAVFTQMKDTLKPEQVTAIQNLTWTQQDMQAIMQQYGIGNGFGGQGGFNGTVSPEQQATFQARRSQNGGGGFGGPGGGGPGGGQGGFGGQGGTGGNTTGSATRTPSPAQLNRRAIGFNSIFIDPVIKLLQTKSAQ